MKKPQKGDLVFMTPAGPVAAPVELWLASLLSVMDSRQRQIVINKVVGTSEKRIAVPKPGQILNLGGR